MRKAQKALPSYPQLLSSLSEKSMAEVVPTDEEDRPLAIRFNTKDSLPQDYRSWRALTWADKEIQRTTGSHDVVIPFCVNNALRERFVEVYGDSVPPEWSDAARQGNSKLRSCQMVWVRHEVALIE
jgi:hypothetical protein